MNRIKIAHRDAKNWSDWVALSAVRVMRFGLDFATGYKHDHGVATGEKKPIDGKQSFAMDERKYMIR